MHLGPQINTLFKFFKQDIDGLGPNFFGEMSEVQQLDCCRSFGRCATPPGSSTCLSAPPRRRSASLLCCVAESLGFVGSSASIAKHAMAIEQGGKGDTFSVIAAGSVTVLINGHEIRQKGQGECFGETELDKPGEKRIASVMALEDTVRDAAASSPFLTPALHMQGQWAARKCVPCRAVHRFVRR